MDVTFLNSGCFTAQKDLFRYGYTNLSTREYILYKLCTQITGKIIDESVKNCCIFVYLDGANYDKEEYRQVTWDELMKECTPVEVIVYE